MIETEAVNAGIGIYGFLIGQMEALRHQVSIPFFICFSSAAVL